MMTRRLSWVIVGPALAMPVAATAQDPMNWHAAQVAGFETMCDKFLALADTLRASSRTTLSRVQTMPASDQVSFTAAMSWVTSASIKRVSNWSD